MSRSAASRSRPSSLRWLVKNGFELGNHTHDHLPLRDMNDDEVQRQLVTGEEVIHRAVPGYKVESMSLPLGVDAPPRDACRAGQLAGASATGPTGSCSSAPIRRPRRSPESFDRGAIPRIRRSHAGWNGERDFAFSYWMHELEQSGAPLRLGRRSRDSRGSFRC